MGGPQPNGSAGIRSGGARLLASPGDDRVSAALTAVREAPSIVQALRRIDDLQAAARHAGVVSGLELSEAAADPHDQVLAIAAVHGLGALPDAVGHPALLALLDAGPDHLREHAAWALGAGPPAPEAISRLAAMVATGGFAGMLAAARLTKEGVDVTAIEPA